MVNLAKEYSDKQVTPFGGMSLMKRFLDQTKIREYLSTLSLPQPDCENRIKELKQDFGLENFCLQDFWATEASFRFIMVGYNLMSLFRHFALNHHNRATLKTLKSYCFALGAWTVNHSNKRCSKYLYLPKEDLGLREAHPFNTLMHNAGL